MCVFDPHTFFALEGSTPTGEVGEGDIKIM